MMFALLIISFAVVASLAATKQRKMANIPKLDMCEKEVPALFLGSYSNSTEHLSFVRAGVGSGVFICPDCDSRCVNEYNAAAYAVYSYKNDAFQPAVPYSFSACSDPCPDPNKAAQCPCINPKGTKSCPLLCKWKPDSDHKQCSSESFKTSTIAGCYCYYTLTKGTGSWLSRVSQLIHDDVCGAVAATYGTVQSLQIVLSLSTVIVNAGLHGIALRLSKFEYNDSSDMEASQLISKIFLSQYINTAFILLIVYAKSSSSNKLVTLLHSFNIIDGYYKDFTTDWFGDVGVQLTMTALIGALTPHIGPLLQHFLILPFKRRVARLAMASGHPKFAMQQDLSDLYVGPRFDVTLRYAQLLNFIFLSMTFSAGLPLLLILALVNFVLSYVFDRFLLLRFYARPPQRNERLQRKVNSILPYAVFVHLGFAAWMFGSENIFGDIKKFSSVTTSFKSEAAAVGGGSMLTRISKSNVMPIFLLWLAAWLLRVSRHYALLVRH